MATQPTLAQLAADLSDHLTFVVIAESTALWNPHSPEFKEHLRAHYQWGADMTAADKILVAGPVDFGQKPDTPEGWPSVSGLIVIKAKTRQEAQELACNEPLHKAGLRRNVVHEWRLRVGGKETLDFLGAKLA
ncbi:hypothetical protein BDR26DRAFT_891252 [Obelidium mucronatum]|nr:hypothetical protein BDR26DRAFT_891252 [Obelidium mucronatum]